MSITPNGKIEIYQKLSNSGRAKLFYVTKITDLVGLKVGKTYKLTIEPDDRVIE